LNVQVTWCQVIFGVKNIGIFPHIHGKTWQKNATNIGNKGIVS